MQLPESVFYAQLFFLFDEIMFLENLGPLQTTLGKSLSFLSSQQA